MRNEPQLRARRALRRGTDRELALDAGDWFAEEVVRSACATLESFCDNPDKGDRRAERVADRCLATFRVPPIEPPRAEPHASDAFASTMERQRRRRHLYDVGSAVRVEQISAAEVVDERLAVVAVADDAVHRLRRRVRHSPLNLPAAAAQFDVSGHRHPMYHRLMIQQWGPGQEELIWEGRPTWKAWALNWIAGWVLLPVLVGLFLLIPVWVRTRSTRWRLTSRRIETETGLLSKRVDTLELWRIRDVEFRQSLVDRMAGISSLLITAHDGTSPVLEVRGAPGDRSVYDRLMSAVMQARQQRGVMNLNP